MSALLSVAPTIAGATPAPAAVSASDTIDIGQCGPNGVDVRVINAGGSPDTVTVVDPNLTVAGSAATSPTVTVPATTGIRVIRISRLFLNSSNQITLQHSFTTTVTCEVEKI